MLADLAKRFPPLYECSVCGASVSVTPRGEGVEPLIEWPCGHVGATVYANRKVTLRGVGELNAMGAMQRATIKFTLSLRQFLSMMTGRSI